MREYYVNYRSITKAQSAQRLLQQRGISAELLRTPKALQENGCGYTLRMTEKAYARARPLLQGHGKIYLYQSGGWEEAAP